MIINFKIFESLEEVSLQNDFANVIVDLYDFENRTAQNNFYDCSDDNSYMFRILEFYKNEIMMDIEYYKNCDWILIHCYEDYVVSNFIKNVLAEYSEIISYGGPWMISTFKLENLPKAIEKLSVDNYKM